MQPFLESELFRTLGAAAIGGLVGGLAGGLLVLLGTYRLRKWELATQYRVANISETYIALSREIGEALKYWKRTSSLEHIPISGISTGDATPFLPDPSIWRGLLEEGRARIIKFTNKTLYKRLDEFYSTHYPKIEELGRELRKSRDALITEWGEMILKVQDPDQWEQLRGDSRYLAKNLIEREVQGHLFVDMKRDDLVKLIARSIDYSIKQTRLLTVKDSAFLAELMFGVAAPKIKVIHDGIKNISDGGFQKDAESLRELIHDKIGNPV